MATFSEIAQDYATRIATARLSSGHIKASAAGHSIRFDASSLESALKYVVTNLDTWTVDGKPLTTEQRRQILEQMIEKLGYSDPLGFFGEVKASSNTATMTLITTLTNVLRPSGK